MIDNDQLKAVELNDSQALLLAGPGCGKTHILARRVFHANTVHEVPFAHMLCLTFTNRAAREMMKRIDQYLGYAPAGLFIGNIHSFCLRFLHANRLIAPDATVIDEEDAADYIENTLDIKGARAVRDFLDKAAFIWQLDHDHPERVIRRPKIQPSESDCEKIALFVQFKDENRLIDYDEILLRTYTALLDKDSDMLKMTGYTWLQVDEVQDMTPLQLSIIDGLCARGKRTALYLGDEQQAIFGFLGAGGRALDIVKRQCGTNILRLQRNYRSPGYLVRLCNRLANKYLNIDPDFLPDAVATGSIAHPLVKWRGDAVTLRLMAAARARRLLEEFPDENVAILVHTNKQGQEMADLLSEHGFDFFHVSRPDIFHQAAFKTVWSHLAVVQRPTRSQEWARILYQCRAVRTLAGARNLMNILRDSAMTGEELMYLDRPSAIGRFCENIENPQRTVVVIDTETTGLDTDSDDVIQIAAVRTRLGCEVPDGRFCIFIRTDRHIPRYLADGIDNPMREAYAKAELHEADEALDIFARWLGDDSIIAGHNLAFDTEILRQNYSRRTSVPLPRQLQADAVTIDTLQLSRLLLPSLWSHRLAYLIDYLKIEGINSHNAIDDVAATVELMKVLHNMAPPKLDRQRKVRGNTNIVRASLRLERAYNELYKATKATMSGRGGTLAEAMQQAYRFFLNNGYINSIPHFAYFIEMVDTLVVDSSEHGLRKQAEAHLTDLTGFNESDLLANGIVSERLSVMTVHKAKGLEMDNVIILDAGSGFGSSLDYARLLYVAFSRAKKRLYAGRSRWNENAMLEDVVSPFEEVPQSEVAAECRRESRRRL